MILAGPPGIPASGKRPLTRHGRPARRRTDSARSQRVKPGTASGNRHGLAVSRKAAGGEHEPSPGFARHAGWSAADGEHGCRAGAGRR